MKRRNHPAPPEATGWECDKMDPRGFEANFAGYIGRLIDAGVKVDGVLVDSWECGSQSWTWEMEAEFKRRTGYALRPWLPALFGYILGSEVETEKFLLDWRNVCSRLVEENYYGAIARLARERGMSVVYETAFGDVMPGDRHTDVSRRRREPQAVGKQTAFRQSLQVRLPQRRRADERGRRRGRAACDRRVSRLRAADGFAGIPRPLDPERDVPASCDRGEDRRACGKGGTGKELVQVRAALRRLKG